MKVDFGASRKQAEADGLIGKGGIYKCIEGDNRIRLMSECLPHMNEYKGEKSFKWLTYVLDRRDGKVKPYFMPHKIYKAIEALQTSDDYAFVEVPMPYDVTIRAKGAGTMDVEYTLMPARREVPLTDDEQRELEAQKPLRELQTAMKEKARTSSPQDAPHPAADTNMTDEDVPF